MMILYLGVLFLLTCQLEVNGQQQQQRQFKSDFELFREATTLPPNATIPAANTTVCYDLVGCFSNAPPFNNSANYLPVSPDELKTKFVLFTSLKENTKEVVTYTDENSIKNSKFNRNYPLKIVIHGFQNTGETPWVPEIAENLLTAEKEKVNVITVDWGLGAVFPLYYNAAANTRLVGRQTCLLVKMIRRLYYGDVWSKDFNIHCIGHSLGAHTCGYASSECDSKFDRITAMDPAGPNFESFEAKVRIDPTDAKFVDVIHSNGDNLLTGNFGMQLACGHVDYYPNGGKQQPGCPGILSVIGGLFSNASAALGGVSCSHGRAVEFFSESIISPCRFRGYPCDSITNFEKGNCLDCSNGNCDSMGYYASTKSRGIKYLITSDKAPFCGAAHLSEVTISSTNVKTAGEILLLLKSGSNLQNVSLSKQSDDLNANNVFKKVFVIDIDLRYADQSVIQFLKKPKPLFGSDPNAPRVTIDKIRISNIENQNEVFSQCNSGLVLEDKIPQSINFKNYDCQLSYKTADTNSVFMKFLNKMRASVRR